MRSLPENVMHAISDAVADRTYRGQSGAVPNRLRRLRGLICLWIQRARQRRALARLDDRLLRDIGLDRKQAGAEAAKPFWRP